MPTCIIVNTVSIFEDMHYLKLVVISTTHLYLYLLSLTELQNDSINAFVKKIPTNKKSQQYGQWAVNIQTAAKAIPRRAGRETNSSVRSLIVIADHLLVRAVCSLSSINFL